MTDRPGAVVDASAVVSLLLDDGLAGRAVERAVGARDLAAPSLLPYEAAQAFRGLDRGGRPTARVEIALRGLFRLPIELHGMEALVGRVWGLRSNVSAYDASYVALAERLGAPLITLDRRLARASGPRCEFIVPI